MIVPGSNLLSKALRVIRAQPVSYYLNTGRTRNSNGIYDADYAAPKAILGSVQAVPLNNYKALDLDFARNYVTLYTNTPLIGVQRDVSGDLFAFAGKVYQCVSTTDWLAMDGWNSVMAVQVDTALPVVTNYVVTPADIHVATPSGNRIINPGAIA